MFPKCAVKVPPMPRPSRAHVLPHQADRRWDEGTKEREMAAEHEEDDESRQ